MKTRTKHEVHQVQYTSKIKTPSNYNKRAYSSQAGYTSDSRLRMNKKKQAEESVNDGRSHSNKKFDYGSKLREKRNYVYYVSGVGYVSKDEQPKIPEPKPKQISIPKRVKKEEDTFIEKKEIIYNYQYYETKNLKKPNKTSNVFHRRLSQPFEVTRQIRKNKVTPYAYQQRVLVPGGEEVYEMHEASYIPKSYNQPNQKRVYTEVVSKRNNMPLNDKEMGNEQINEEVTEDVYYQEQAEGENNHEFYKSKNVSNKRGEGVSVYYQKGKKSTSSYLKGNSSFQGNNPYKGQLRKNETGNSSGQK